MIKTGLQGNVLASEVKESDYNNLANRPQINGVILSGNKTASQLGLAPAGYGDDSVWDVDLSVDKVGNKITLKAMDKKGNIIYNNSITLPDDEYNDAKLDNDTLKITLTRQSGETTELDFTEIFNKYVLKTTKIGSHDLEDDITIEELDDDLKDYPTTLTNKNISADDNLITELETDNFKEGVIQKVIDEIAPEDTRLPTEKAVVDYVKLKTIKTAELTYEINPNYPSFYKERIVLKNEAGDIVCEAEDNGKWVDKDTEQELENKTISTDKNKLIFGTTYKDKDKNQGFRSENNKLYFLDSDGVERCLNADYKINDLLIPEWEAIGNKQIITDKSLTTEMEGDNIKLYVPHPVEVMTKAEYDTSEQKPEVFYVITDYPCEDIKEERVMVDNRWQITRTATTTPTLTFIQNGEVHNKKAYYTKEEANTLLDYKEDIINGAGSTIAHDDLEANKILVSDSNGKISASIYDADLLETIGLILEPNYFLSTLAQQYITIAYIKGYVLNKKSNSYRLEISMDVYNQVGNWNSGGLMTIEMPEEYKLNYIASVPKGFWCKACRFKATDDYTFADVIFRYTTDTTIQVFLPNCDLFAKKGRINLSIELF